MDCCFGNKNIILVDAHLDIAYNVFAHGRNPLLSLEEIRQLEMDDPSGEGTATVSFQELFSECAGIVFGTIFVAPANEKNPPNGQTNYSNANEAHEFGLRQLDYYRQLSVYRKYTQLPNEIRLIGSSDHVKNVVESRGTNSRIVGIVPLMEGADPIRDPDELEFWYDRGLRIIGLAWSETKYSGCSWTNDKGITESGFQLLGEMLRFGTNGMILDISHMSDKAIDDSINHYEGPIIASHCNSRAIKNSPRNLTDEHIKKLAELGSVIGIVLYNNFIVDKPQSELKETVSIEDLFRHIDHICQVTGSCDHVGIGSDMDGGFGVEELPKEIDRHSDILKIAELLDKHNYPADNIHKIMGLNWISFLEKNL